MNEGERVRAAVRIVNGCWEWQLSRDREGYGRMYAWGRQSLLAHRVSYETFVGQIQHDMELDHLCRNRACVNPDHLEQVTHAENMKRRRPIEAKAICANGHEQNAKNTHETVRRNGQKHRVCRPCSAAASRRYLEKKREAKTA